MILRLYARVLLALLVALATPQAATCQPLAAAPKRHLRSKRSTYKRYKRRRLRQKHTSPQPVPDEPLRYPPAANKPLPGTLMLPRELTHLAPPPVEEEVPAPLFRRLSGMWGLEVQAGCAAIGYHIALEASYLFTPRWQTKLGLGLEYCAMDSRKYYNLFTQPALLYNLLSHQSRLYWNLFVGIPLFYDHFYEARLPTQIQSWNIGLAMGLELAFFIVHRWEVLFTAAPRLLLQSQPHGNLDYYLSLGTRFSF